MIDACAIVGAHRIAKYLGMSESKLHKVHLKNMVALGVVFYLRGGHPPRKLVCAFPERLQRWAGEKSSLGEIL